VDARNICSESLKSGCYATRDLFLETTMYHKNSGIKISAFILVLGAYVHSTGLHHLPHRA
jgi:hypothetical protein